MVPNWSGSKRPNTIRRTVVLLVPGRSNGFCYISAIQRPWIVSMNKIRIKYRVFIFVFIYYCYGREETIDLFVTDSLSVCGHGFQRQIRSGFFLSLSFARQTLPWPLHVLLGRISFLFLGQSCYVFPWAVLLCCKDWVFTVLCCGLRCIVISCRLLFDFLAIFVHFILIVVIWSVCNCVFFFLKKSFIITSNFTRRSERSDSWMPKDRQGCRFRGRRMK